MLLATRWFGSRCRELGEQLAEAAAQGFHGVAMLPDTRPSEWDGGASRRGGPEVGAASWDLLVPLPAQEPPARCWRLERVPEVLAALHATGCRRLLLPAGEDLDDARRARGRRILGRLQTEGSLQPDDEALATVRAADRLPLERQLEELAALLHGLARRAPQLEVALVAHPSPAGLLDPAGFELLVAALGDAAPRLWFDTGTAEARAAAGLERPGAWLDAWGARIAGAALHDWANGQGQLPPGAGVVDWTLVREYLPRDAIRVLDLAPSYPVGVLSEARAALAAQQLA